MASLAKFSDQTSAFCSVASRLAASEEADALLFLLEKPLDWKQLNDATGELPVLVASDDKKCLKAAKAAGFSTVPLNTPDSPVYDQLAQALLESVADDLLSPGSSVVAVYSGFEAGVIDSLSVIRLDEHLGRLTVHDLRKLETRVPLDTLKLAVDLAVDIGREGREGKPVGTLFVVGDHKKVLEHSHPLGFDPVKGYVLAERRLEDSKVREALKEIAQLDGAFIISAKGSVTAAAQHISAPAADVTLSKGLGARHWAAAAISRATTAVAITVSESTGTVRVFQNGEVMLRIEPFRRAMKWKDFEFEPPAGGD